MSRKELIIINVICILAYALFWWALEFELSKEVVLSSNDSNSYLAVTDWIFGGEVTGHTGKRPILFPLLMGLPYKLFGLSGIWFLQFLFWLVGINLCVHAITKWTNNKIYGWIVLTILLSNLSLMAMTFHALTEVPTFFFLSVLLYFIVYKIDKFKTIYFIHGVLLILVLLTLIKGAFYYLVLLCIAILVLFYGRQYLKTPRSLFFFGLILLPLLGQMTLVKSLHGEFVVSTIGSDTFKNYYFARAVTEIEGRDRAEVLAEVENLNSNEIQSYILDHKRGFYNQFTRNIRENVTGESVYLDLGKATRSPKAGSYMHSMNELSYYIHWFGLLAILWSLIISFRAKNFLAVFQIVLLSSLTYYYILTTGLSFWQGDRLVLPIIAIWSTLYVAMIASLIRKIPLKSTTT
mgnify:CR=1 FL=1